jgi:hypothetical protein
MNPKMKRSAERLFRESPEFRRFVDAVYPTAVREIGKALLKEREQGIWVLDGIAAIEEDVSERADFDDDERATIRERIARLRADLAAVTAIENTHDRSAAVRAIETAIMLAMLIGLSPDKLSALRARVDRDSQAGRGLTGGKNSGKTRRKKAIDDWESDGLKHAQTFVKDNPGASQDAIAEQIRFRLDARAPGHRQVKTRVSEWQNTGKLSKPLRK